MWTLREPDPEAVEMLVAGLGMSRPAARALALRGVASTLDARSFLDPSMDALHDPYAMDAMGVAVERLRKAVRDQEPIRVVTDYDVDGTTSSLILQATLKILGADTVSYHIPHRMTEGYGFSIQAAERAREEDMRLIVTADIGVKDHAAVTRARELGLEVIVCDHHLPPGEDVPADATAVLCPPKLGCEYPNTALAACGVSFKLAQALLAEHPRREVYLRSMLKLAAMGTVADVVDLMTQENRALVSLGLQELNRARHNPGLAALLRVSGTVPGSIRSSDLGFRIGPRINAAGRMDSATRIVELLTTRDPETARSRAKEIDDLNTHRRSVQESMVRWAMDQAKAQDPLPSFLLIARPEGPDWHRGVAGIVAARVRDALNRPTGVVAIQGDRATGSIRSIPEVHAVQCLDAAAELLDRYGGHPAAAGFSLNPAHLEAFASTLQAAATAQLDGDAPTRTHDTDAVIPVGMADFRLQRELERLAPHGKGNPQPQLTVVGGTVRNTRLIKDKHLKGTLYGEGAPLEFIWWGGAPFRDQVEGQRVDLLGTLGVRTWQGIERLQLTVEDARPGE